MRAAAMLVPFAIAVVASCTDDDAPPLTADASTFVDELCQLLRPCCTPLADPETKCVTTAQALARGKAFDAVRAKACLDGLRVEARSAMFCRRSPDLVTCGAVFTTSSAKEPGQPCSASAECASSADSDGVCLGVAPDARCRRVRQARGKEGDPCVGTRASGTTEPLSHAPDGTVALCFLVDGLQCDSSTKKCVKRGGLGATCIASVGACVEEAFCPRQTHQCSSRTAAGGKCDDTEECSPGHHCGSDGAGDGACIPLAKLHEPCVRGDECDPAAGLVCDPETATCVVDLAGAEKTCSGAAALVQ
jgi:hypothetical protein